MASHRCARALAIATIGGSIACGSASSPTTPAINSASIALLGLTATVEPLTTTPQPGLLYRLTYQVHESGGTIGATLVTQHFALSDGVTADGDFKSTPTTHVAPMGTVTVQSTLSLYPATRPASHVTFSITYTDDRGQAGTASADADVTRIGL